MLENHRTEPLGGACYNDCWEEYYICTVCGEIQNNFSIVHPYHNEHLETKEIPTTCTTDGLRIDTSTCDCGACNSYVEKVIPTSGHFFRDEIQNETRQKENGEWEAKYLSVCQRCGEIGGETWY